MTDGLSIGLIVEGHGDVAAAPVLVRRLVESLGTWAAILPAHRVPKTRMAAELNRAIRLQMSRVGSVGGVLVLVDADDDDPADLGRRLVAVIDNDLVSRCAVVVATKEYEAWFLGGIESLRQHKSVRDEALHEGDPEGPRDAKGRVSNQMLENYQETIH